VFLLAALFLATLLRCHGSILPSIVHGMQRTNSLRLIECIESMKNDVKRKIGTRRYRGAMNDECDDVRVKNAKKFSAQAEG
jgi:hypothetical protein